MAKIFSSLEDVSSVINNSVNVSITHEEEMTVYGTISEHHGLEDCVSKCKHTDYSIRVDDLNKIRLRIITTDDDTINELTFKQKKKDDNVSTEYTIYVDDNLVDYFKSLGEIPNIYTRYVFSSSEVTFNYVDEEGNKNNIKLPSVKYEVDIFDNAKDLCKIEVELQELKEILKSKTNGYQGDLKIFIKVNHLPFKPIDVFGLDKSDTRIKEFWNKVKNHE